MAIMMADYTKEQDDIKFYTTRVQQTKEEIAALEAQRVQREAEMDRYNKLLEDLHSIVNLETALWTPRIEDAAPDTGGTAPEPLPSEGNGNGNGHGNAPAAQQAPPTRPTRVRAPRAAAKTAAPAKAAPAVPTPTPPADGSRREPGWSGWKALLGTLSQPKALVAMAEAQPDREIDVDEAVTILTRIGVLGMKGKEARTRVNYTLRTDAKWPVTGRTKTPFTAVIEGQRYKLTEG